MKIKCYYNSDIFKIYSILLQKKLPLRFALLRYEKT